MTHMELGIYGAKRQTWIGNGARAILRKLRMKHPDADTDEMVELMLPLMQKNEEALSQILAYWIPRNLTSLEPPQEIDPKEKKKRSRKLEKAVQAAKQTAQRYCLMTMIIPTVETEKPLGQCEVLDLVECTGWLAKIRAKLKPGQKVKDVFTESQLWKLRASK